MAPVDPYILVGRGKDFAWSFTSANNDNVDQFLERLCNRNGSRPTRASTSYVYKGKCVAMERFTAGVLKGTGGQPDTTVAYWQTVHGPVSGTVTVHRRPYAIATLRSTRGRKPASAVAMADLNDNTVHSPEHVLPRRERDGDHVQPGLHHSKTSRCSRQGGCPSARPGVDPNSPHSAWGNSTGAGSSARTGIHTRSTRGPA